MGLFFVYILKSSVCLAAFYLFYRLLLSRETFHRFNRFALLGTLLFSCLLPLIEVSVRQETEIHQTMMTLEQWLLLADAMNTAEVQMPEVTVTWIQVALLLYLVGILFFAFRNIYSLLHMVLLLRSGRRESMDKYISGKKKVTLIIHNKEIAPFSWMKYVVISQKDLEENGREILIHELAHIHNRHSLDLLVADICIFFQWFNPASWLLKQELQNIHEYEADETVIKEGVDAKQYQLLLIKKAVGTRLYSMANSFNHSKLKKRITMMLKEKSSPWARLKYLYVLPLAAVAVTAFARPEVSKQVEEISRMSDALGKDQVNLLFSRIHDISAVKVNDLAAIVETKVAESNLLHTDSSPQDTVKSPITIVRYGTLKEARNSSDELKVEGFSLNSDAKVVNATKQSAKDSPLCIIDGKECPLDIMNALDPDKIESITVLKDKSALEIYGDKGKNGVLLITLKKDRQQIGVRIAERNNKVVIPGIGSVYSTEKADMKNITIYVDNVKTDLKGGQLNDVVPADKIESIDVRKNSDGGGEIYITLKNGKGIEKTSVQGSMKVEGIVKDEQGEPLISASVIIEGTAAGTITDKDGKFALSVPDKNAVLVVSFIDMPTVKVKAQPSLTVVLKEK